MTKSGRSSAKTWAQNGCAVRSRRFALRRLASQKSTSSKSNRTGASAPRNWRRPMTDIKYTDDGKKVMVVGKLNAQQTIVQEIFVSAGQEIPSGENFVV